MKQKIQYILAVLGPVSVAGSQFSIAYLLLHKLQAYDFGIFSFSLLVIQLSLSLSNALFCAPMAYDTDRPEGHLVYKSAGFLFSISTSAIVFLAFLISTSLQTAMSLGVYAFLANLRWFARAFAYVSFDPVRAFISDLTFSITLGLTFLLVITTAEISAHAVFICYAFSAFMSLLPFGLHSFLTDAMQMRLRHLRSYGDVWNKYSRHALVGVLSTEATSNAHAYMITLIFGATSFAPIAAASLSTRPITLCANAITDIERPRLAREIASQQYSKLSRSVLLFRILLIAGWFFSAMAMYLIAYVKPGILFGSYEFSVMLHASSVWLAMAFFRNVTRPESVLLQAGGEFKPLANITVITGVISIVGSAILLLNAGPVASLYGVLIGDITASVLILVQCKKFQRTSIGL